MANEERQYIIIVGCGRLGSLLAGELSQQGHDVIVIDRYEEAFDKLPGTFSGFTLTGDVVEINALRRAEVHRADAVFATTRQDNTNLMVAQIARQIYGVSCVVARVYDPNHQRLYTEFEVTTISPTRLSANAFLNATGAKDLS
jgi:trk system potassium uptake protein TrkA